MAEAVDYVKRHTKESDHKKGISGDQPSSVGVSGIQFTILADVQTSYFQKRQCPKGEKASLVVFYQILPLKQSSGSKDTVLENDPDSANVALRNHGGQKPVFILKYYNLFNLEQCDGITAPPPDEPHHQFTPLRQQNGLYQTWINRQ